jgi:hypothetical protein
MQVPYIDKQTLNITANVENLQGADEVKISA